MNLALKCTAIAVFSIAISACGEKGSKNSSNNEKTLPTESPLPESMNPSQNKDESLTYEEKLNRALEKHKDTFKEDYNEYKKENDIIQKELVSCQNQNISCKIANDKAAKFLSFNDRQAIEAVGYWIPLDMSEFTNNSIGIIEITNKNLIMCHIYNTFSKNIGISFNLKTITPSSLSIRNINFIPKYKKNMDTLNLENSKYAGSYSAHSFYRINKEIFDLIKQKTDCK